MLLRVRDLYDIHISIKHMYILIWTYCYKPIGVESINESGHEAHLTGWCQDVKV